MQVKIYTDVSYIYSHIMRSINYEKWADYIEQICRDEVGVPDRVLEIACGKGSIASIISKKFRFYVACDLSEKMVKQIKSSRILKLSADMTQLPFKNKFDFIFSTFDSINYLTDKKILSRLFDEVSLCLNQSGVFTFDVSLENNSRKYLRYLNRNGKVNGIKFRQQSNYNEKSRFHYNYFEIQFADGKKSEEIHKQKIYRFEDYFDVIDKSDFYVSKCYDAFTQINATENSERAQFILKKKRSHADF